jgi:hypothetical protein
MPPATAPTGSPASVSGVRRRFQAGGTVGEGAFDVERPADRELPDALRQGERCYVLATRQIGKSSLRLRAAKKLAAEGVACVHIDLTGLGSETSTAESRYFGLTSEIADQLGLPGLQPHLRTRSAEPVFASAMPASRLVKRAVSSKKMRSIAARTSDFAGIPRPRMCVAPVHLAQRRRRSQGARVDDTPDTPRRTGRVVARGEVSSWSTQPRRRI